MVAREEERNGWSDIPRDVFKEILRKLTLVDYLRCQRVCRSWRRTVKNVVATKGTTCHPAPQFPFLMLLPRDLHGTRGSAILSDITQEEDHSLYPIPTQRWNTFDKVFPVKGGWLMFSSNRNRGPFLFLNPLSEEQVELPPLPFLHGEISIAFVFSCAPDSPDFLVVACVNKQQLAFCKITDKSWTPIPTIDSQLYLLEEFIILDWKLDAMNMHSRLIVTIFNLKTFEKLQLWNVMFQAKRHEIGTLARDGDDTLFVLYNGIRTYSNERNIWRTKGFRVFKLDMCGLRWIEVDDLGDRVLLMDSDGIQVMHLY